MSSASFEYVDYDRNAEGLTLAQLAAGYEEAATATPGRGDTSEVLLSACTLCISTSRPSMNKDFVPVRPHSLQDTGLSAETVERLCCRHLYVHGSASGQVLSERVGLPLSVLSPILKSLKEAMLVVYKGMATLEDYEYMLTKTGIEHASADMALCSYAESAPVLFSEYVNAVARQSIEHQQIDQSKLKNAFADLLVAPDMLDLLGPAINSGKGMFLYGQPGNGKTSIAERISKAYGPYIWIPRVLDIDGDLVRLFDPILHEAVEEEPEQQIDRRWIRIRRPTVVVGGELTMDQLEMRHDAATNVCEAPLQMKSNCGVLVIDDFGRQRMSTIDLLNRWIVPLEKRYDYQSLGSGKKVQVPFDQFVVFSTNLEPKDLVDEAFIRRIPYKIEITDPSAVSFRSIFESVAPGLDIEIEEGALDYLLREHYAAANRSLRACHPRDLLLQVRSVCLYKGTPLVATPANLDRAAQNYFSVM